MDDIYSQNYPTELEKLHGIATERQKRYDKWCSTDIQKLSTSELYNEVKWWKNEVLCDIRQSKVVPEDNSIVYTAIIVNMAHASMIHGAVQQEYIKKLENELKSLKNKSPKF